MLIEAFQEKQDSFFPEMITWVKHQEDSIVYHAARDNNYVYS